MNKFFKISALLTVLSLGIMSCDKLDAPYATVKEITSDTNKRAIVIEDYTGHTCVNCPGAAQTARSLEELYHQQVMVMAIHAGYYAKPDSSQGSLYQNDFRSATGNDWFLNAAFKIDQNPKGMVNRFPYNTNISMLPGVWAGAVADMAKKPKAAVMSMAHSYDAVSGVIQTRIDTRFLIHAAGTYNLTVCILEDSIYGAQKNNDPKVDSVPEIKHYLFMDVLRGSINGSYGEAITSNIDTTKIISKTYQYQLAPGLVMKNCKIIAFVSNAATYEILHAKVKRLPAAK